MVLKKTFVVLNVRRRSAEIYLLNLEREVLNVGREGRMGRYLDGGGANKKSFFLKNLKKTE